MKRKGMGAASRKRRQLAARPVDGRGFEEVVGFGGLGGLPDGLRVKIEADGFRVRQVGPDEFEAFRVVRRVA